MIIWYLKSRVPKVLQIVLKLLLRPLKSFQNPYGGLYGGFFGSFHYGKRLLVGVFVGKINTAQLGAKGPILGVVGASSVPILASTWSLHVGPPRGASTWSTVRDNLFRMSLNFGQHPPFFSKMRTFFKNRPRWYGFYSNSAPYQWSRFLTCIFKKIHVGIFSQISRCR